MLAAMGIAAFLCIFVGSFPGLLYSLLPYPVEYVPYTVPHVVGQTQLLFFSALAFALLLLSGIYPAEQRCVNLDADWLYRKGGRLFYTAMDRGMNGLIRVCERVFVDGLAGGLARFAKDGPARLQLMAAVPVWILTEVQGAEREERRRKMVRAARTGSMPIGVIAFSAVLYLAILFYVRLKPVSGYEGL